MIKNLVYYGDSLLRKKCKEVTEITDEVRQICQDLSDTVTKHNGAGLAAPQIGYDLRIFVSRYGKEVNEEGLPIIISPKVYINPKISTPSTAMITQNEGCLSIPGIQEGVIRPMTIELEAMDQEGNLFKEIASGWHARCIMHENDHLNGVLFIDRLPAGVKKKLEPTLKAIKKKYHT